MKKFNILLVSSSLLLLSLNMRAGTEDPCGSTLRLTQRINRGEIRQPQAIETLVATNVVDGDAQAEYKAGHSITLLPGFSAERGATFSAQVKSCSCDAAQLAAASEANRLTLTAYPNPFVENTVIRYSLTESSPVTLSLLSEQGQIVEVLVNGETQEKGIHEYTFRNTSISTLVYLYSLRTNQGVISKRLIKQH